MFKSKKQTNGPSDGVIASRAGLSTIAIVIIVAIVVILIAGGGAAATFIGHVGPLATALGYDKTDSDKPTGAAGSGSSTSETAAGTLKPEQKKVLSQTQTKIDTLVAAGDTKSIQKADEAAETQVEVAKESGDDEYIVSSELAQADLLINTDRAQQAINDVLVPLDQKYGNNATYNYRIYSYFGLAYMTLGNTVKANEYGNRIPAVEDKE